MCKNFIKRNAWVKGSREGASDNRSGRFQSAAAGSLGQLPSLLKKVWGAHSHECQTHKGTPKAGRSRLVKQGHNVIREPSSLYLSSPRHSACSFLLVVRNGYAGPAIMSEFQQIGRSEGWRSRHPSPFEDISLLEVAHTHHLHLHPLTTIADDPM